MLLSLAIRNVWTRAPSASSTAFVYRATAAGAAASPGLDSFAFTAVKKRVEADPTDIAAAWIGLTMSAACGCNVDGIPAKAGLADANSINESTAVSNGFAKICAWKWIHCVCVSEGEGGEAPMMVAASSSEVRQIK